MKPYEPYEPNEIGDRAASAEELYLPSSNNAYICSKLAQNYSKLAN